MKKLNDKEIEMVSGSIGINDIHFGSFVRMTANCALKVGIFAGKIIMIPYDATRGAISGAMWGIKGCS